MFAKFSEESQINEIIRKHDLTMGFVSALAKHAGIPRCSEPTLATALNGKGLSYGTGQPLLHLMKRLDAFVTLFSPVRVELDNAADVFDWMILTETGRMKVFSLQDDALMEKTTVLDSGTF